MYPTVVLSTLFHTVLNVVCMFLAHEVAEHIQMQRKYTGVRILFFYVMHQGLYRPVWTIGHVSESFGCMQALEALGMNSGSGLNVGTPELNSRA